jgi:hypothetical protein
MNEPGVPVPLVTGSPTDVPWTYSYEEATGVLWRFTGSEGWTEVGAFQGRPLTSKVRVICDKASYTYENSAFTVASNGCLIVVTDGQRRALFNASQWVGADYV